MQNMIATPPPSQPSALSANCCSVYVLACIWDLEAFGKTPGKRNRRQPEFSSHVFAVDPAELGIKSHILLQHFLQFTQQMDVRAGLTCGKLAQTPHLLPLQQLTYGDMLHAS